METSVDIWATLSGMIANARTIIVAFTVLLGIGMVVLAVVKTQSFLKTVIAAVLAGLLIWAVNNPEFLGETFERTVIESENSGTTGN